MMFLRNLSLKRLRATRIRPHIEIRRRWIETADERCPLACTWYALLESSDEQDDDSWLCWPAFLHVFEKAGLCTVFIFSSHTHCYKSETVTIL